MLELLGVVIVVACELEDLSRDVSDDVHHIVLRVISVAHLRKVHLIGDP